MDIVPPPGEDQVPRLQAFRAEHPDIEIASPAGSRTGMWSAYQGGTILVVTFGLRQLLDRLDELLAPGYAVTTTKAPVPKWYSRVLSHAVEVHWRRDAPEVVTVPRHGGNTPHGSRRHHRAAHSARKGKGHDAKLKAAKRSRSAQHGQRPQTN